MNCRHCGALLEHTFLDLGFAPLSNAYLTEEDFLRSEIYYPLKLKVCDECWLVQTEDYAKRDEIFSSNYAYFSSTSSTWLNHAANYADKIIGELGLGSDSMVFEVASNDGYLLKNFVSLGIPCLGIEPTASTADAAVLQGIPVVREFFGEALAKQLAEEGKKADLVVGNNVVAHVPDINDFIRGLKVAIKEDGVITLEFPHLLCLIEFAQFDTVYHEHFSYFSLFTLVRIFKEAGLRIWKVEQLPTHGGSLRVYGCHVESNRVTDISVSVLLQREKESGLQQLDAYRGFQMRAEKIKNDFLTFLIAQKTAGKEVAAYGAAAKGNTLLNYAGIKTDLISYVCDAADSKQGKFLPGSHVPILEPATLAERKPDLVVILPWNIADEVKKINEHVYEWGGKFVTVIPTLRIS